MAHSALTNQISASPRTTGGDTPRRPGQRVFTLGVAPVNGWSSLGLAPDNGWSSVGVAPDNVGTFHFCVAFVWRRIQKYFLRQPGQLVANTRRCPGQRVLTLRVAPDNGW